MGPSHGFYRGGKVQRLDRPTVWDGNSLELTSPTINIKIIHFVYFLLKNALLLLLQFALEIEKLLTMSKYVQTGLTFHSEHNTFHCKSRVSCSQNRKLLLSQWTSQLLPFHPC